MRRPLSVWAALLVAALAGALATGATILVLRNSYTTLIEVLLAAFALLAFGVTVYGLLQAALAIVDSAGERRRQDRTVSERRHGDRARQPREP